MPVIAAANFVVKLASLSLNHLLHHVEIGVQLLKEQVALPDENFLQSGEVRGRCRDLFALLRDLIVELVLLNVCLVEDLAYLLHIVAFVQIFEHCFDLLLGENLS